jgi:ribose-phosphate pyrophosphokinase
MWTGGQVPHVADAFTILCGNASRSLAAAVADSVGVPLGAAVVERFPDGEVSVEIRDPVRDKDVFVIQSTAPPVNDHLMELLAIVDACRRASAGRIFAVIPYFGYARSDKRRDRREPISARLVADLLQTAGTDHIITIDLHASQIEGFFRIPVDSLTAVSILCDALRRRLPGDAVVVSPDAGRLKMATDYAQALGTPVVLLHKTRETGADTHVTHLVGDVRERSCLIVDDMISTGGTIIEAVAKLLEMGARPDIAVAATHGVLLGGAKAKLASVPIGDLFVTDSIERQPGPWPHLHVVSVAPFLGNAIRRLASTLTTQ